MANINPSIVWDETLMGPNPNKKPTAPQPTIQPMPTTPATQPQASPLQQFTNTIRDNFTKTNLADSAISAGINTVMQNMPKQQPMQPSGVGVRQTLVNMGIPDAQIGWNGSQVTVGGVPLNIQGMQNVNGRTYANSDSINQAYSTAFPPNTINPQANSDYLAQQGYNQLGEAITTYKDLVNQIQMTPFTDQYAAQKQQYLQQMNKPFKYNPETDLALQQAQKTASRRVMEELNARGILNSSITVDNVSQVMGELMPQYRQIAFDEYNKGIENALKGFNVMQGLTEFDYMQYKDWVNQNLDIAGNGLQLAEKNLDLMFREIQRKDEEDSKLLARQQQEVKDAWERVNTIGYVDNMASLVLGLPAGTLSREARQRAEELEDYLYKEQVNLDKNISLKQMDYEYDMKALKEKNAFDMKMFNAKVAADKASDARSLANQKAVIDYKSTKEKKEEDKGLTYSDYVKYGRDLMDKGFVTEDDLGNKQYEKINDKREIVDWVQGLNMDDAKKENLIDDLGLRSTVNKMFDELTK